MCFPKDIKHASINLSFLQLLFGSSLSNQFQIVEANSQDQVMLFSSNSGALEFWLNAISCRQSLELPIFLSVIYQVIVMIFACLNDLSPCSVPHQFSLAIYQRI